MESFWSAALSSYAIYGSLHEICRPHNSAEYQQSNEALSDLHALSPQVYRGDCALPTCGTASVRMELVR
jgi:hypothetical protein